MAELWRHSWEQLECSSWMLLMWEPQAPHIDIGSVVSCDNFSPEHEVALV